MVLNKWGSFASECLLFLQQEYSCQEHPPLKQLYSFHIASRFTLFSAPREISRSSICWLLKSCLGKPRLGDFPLQASAISSALHDVPMRMYCPSFAGWLLWTSFSCARHPSTWVKSAAEAYLWSSNSVQSFVNLECGLCVVRTREYKYRSGFHLLLCNLTWISVNCLLWCPENSLSTQAFTLMDKLQLFLFWSFLCVYTSFSSWLHQQQRPAYVLAMSVEYHCSLLWDLL